MPDIFYARFSNGSFFRSSFLSFYLPKYSFIQGGFLYFVSVFLSPSLGISFFRFHFGLSNGLLLFIFPSVFLQCSLGQTYASYHLCFYMLLSMYLLFSLCLFISVLATLTYAHSFPRNLPQIEIKKSVGSKQASEVERERKNWQNIQRDRKEKSYEFHNNKRHKVKIDCIAPTRREIYSFCFLVAISFLSSFSLFHLFFL